MPKHNLLLPLPPVPPAQNDAGAAIEAFEDDKDLARINKERAVNLKKFSKEGLTFQRAAENSSHREYNLRQEKKIIHKFREKIGELREFYLNYILPFADKKSAERAKSEVSFADFVFKKNHDNFVIDEQEVRKFNQKNCEFPLKIVFIAEKPVSDDEKFNVFCFVINKRENFEKALKNIAKFKNINIELQDFKKLFYQSKFGKEEDLQFVKTVSVPTELGAMATDEVFSRAAELYEQSLERKPASSANLLEFGSLHGECYKEI